MISIVNYGMGNLGSIVNMCKYLNHKATIISTPEEVLKAEKLILPGVGAFDFAMRTIKQSLLVEPLEEKVLKEKIPILGICLGMQLMTQSSEEGSEAGLGWVEAATHSFKGRVDTTQFKVPHMGWSECSLSNPSSLLEGINADDLKFYFVHSFFVSCENSRHSILKSYYSMPFDSGFQKDNIFGVQFHPEKSHRYGLKLLDNFGRLV